MFGHQVKSFRTLIFVVVTTLIGIELFYCTVAVSLLLIGHQLINVFWAWFVDLIMNIVLWESILLWVCYWFVEPPGEHHSHYWHFPTVFPSIVLLSSYVLSSDVNHVKKYTCYECPTQLLNIFPTFFQIHSEHRQIIKMINFSPQKIVFFWFFPRYFLSLQWLGKMWSLGWVNFFGNQLTLLFSTNG